MQQDWKYWVDEASSQKSVWTRHLRQLPEFPLLATSLFSKQGPQEPASALAGLLAASLTQIAAAYRLLAGSDAPPAPPALLLKRVTAATASRFSRYRESGFLNPENLKRQPARMESALFLAPSILWRPAAWLGLEAFAARRLILLAAGRESRATVAASLTARIPLLFPVHLAPEVKPLLTASLNILADSALRDRPVEFTAAVYACARDVFVQSGAFVNTLINAGQRFDKVTERMAEYDDYADSRAGHGETQDQKLKRWVGLITGPGPVSKTTQQDKDRNKRLRAMERTHRDLTGNPDAALRFHTRLNRDFHEVQNSVDPGGNGSAVEVWDRSGPPHRTRNPMAWTPHEDYHPEGWPALEGRPEPEGGFEEVAYLDRLRRWFKNDPVRYLIVTAFGYLDGCDAEKVHERLHGKLLIEALDNICYGLQESGRMERAEAVFERYFDERLWGRKERLDVSSAKVHEVIGHLDRARRQNRSVEEWSQNA